MAENVQNISDRMDEIGAAVNDISASAGQLQKDSEEMQVDGGGEGTKMSSFVWRLCHTKELICSLGFFTSPVR